MCGGFGDLLVFFVGYGGVFVQVYCQFDLDEWQVMFYVFDEIDVEFLCFGFEDVVLYCDVGLYQMQQVVIGDFGVGILYCCDYLCYFGVYQCIGVWWGVVEVVVGFEGYVGGGVVCIFVGLVQGMDFGVWFVGVDVLVFVDYLVVFDQYVVDVWIWMGGVQFLVCQFQGVGYVQWVGGVYFLVGLWVRCLIFLWNLLRFWKCWQIEVKWMQVILLSFCSLVIISLFSICDLILCLLVVCNWCLMWLMVVFRCLMLIGCFFRVCCMLVCSLFLLNGWWLLFCLIRCGMISLVVLKVVKCLLQVRYLWCWCI